MARSALHPLTIVTSRTSGQSYMLHPMPEGWVLIDPTSVGVLPVSERDLRADYIPHNQKAAILYREWYKPEKPAPAAAPEPEDPRV